MGWGDRLLARLMQTRLLSSIYIIITTFTFILLLLIASQIVFTNQLLQLRGSKNDQQYLVCWLYNYASITMTTGRARFFNQK